jgi:hypothetical protein
VDADEGVRVVLARLVVQWLWHCHILLGHVSGVGGGDHPPGLPEAMDERKPLFVFIIDT